METKLDKPEAEIQSLESLETKNSRNKRIIFNIAIGLVLVGLWIGLVYFGYIFAKDYLDTSINNIQHENAMNMKELKEEISILSSETRNLRASMEDAGIVISNTSDVQSRIDEKLVELERHLQQLEKSLATLQEAPHDAKN
ncbi:MAG: hypothetical protein PHD40_03055 [Syntrophomonadaceae bacterium]|nr:hypothetical protein [Syntrophomonadaceae bacterium]